MTRARRIPPDVAIAAACVLCGMLLILHWTHFGKIIYALDTYVYVDPWNRMAKQLFLWNTYNSAGGDVHWDFSAWPMMAVFGVLSWMFGSSAAQTVQIGFVLGSGWAAMYAMLRLLRFDRSVALIGTCGYAFNPWTMTLMQDYTINGTLFAIPATGALLIAAARFPQYRNGIRLGLVLIAALVAAVIAVEPARLTVTLFLFLFLAVAIAYSEADDRPSFSRWLGGAALLSFAAALWWMPTLLQYFLLKPATATQISEFIGDVRRASFDNVVRFLPIWGWTFPQYYNYAAEYDADVFCYAGGFALAVFGTIALVFRDRSRAGLVRLCVGFALAILFLTKGLHEPLAWINALVYRIPGSVMWREPTTKFPPVALAALAVCTAVVFERLAKSRLDARLHRGAIAGVLVLFAASAQALFTGNAWFGNTFALASAWVTIPPYWYDAARWLNARPDASAMTTLPQLNHYQARYTWGMQAWDWLPADLFHRRNVVLNTVFALKSKQDDAIHEAIGEAVRNPALSLKTVLQNLGIRYVLLRGDAISGASVTITLADLRRRLPGAAERDFGPLAIFDVGPIDYALVSTGHSWISGDYGRSALRGLTLEAMLENVPRVDNALLRGASPSIPPIAYEAAAGNLRAFDRPVRYVWDDRSAAFTARFPAGEAIALERLPRVLPENRTGFTVPAARFLRDEGGAQTLLSAFDPVQVSATELDFSVVNPSQNFVLATVEIAGRPEAAEAFELAANERTYETVAGTSRELVWVRFAHVILKPGINQLRLGTLPAPRAPGTAARADAAYGEIRARVERSFPAAGGGAYVVDVGSIRAGVGVRFEPLIHVSHGDVFPGVSLGAIATVGYRKTKYRCFAPFASDTWQINVRDAVADCFRTAGIEPSADVIAATRLDGVSFVALLPGLPQVNFVQPVRAARLSWLRGGSVLVTRSGTAVTVRDRSAQTAIGLVGFPRLRGAEPHAEPFHGLLPAAAFLQARDGYVLLRQTYDRAWLGLCFGHCPLVLQHVEEAGGWNLWWMAGSGTVAIVNLLVVLQLCCYAASLTAVSAAIWAAAYARPRFSAMN